MIAAVHCDPSNYAESLTTLRWAKRAKRIRNVTSVNRDLSTVGEMAALRARVDFLEAELQARHLVASAWRRGHVGNGPRDLVGVAFRSHPPFFFYDRACHPSPARFPIEQAKEERLEALALETAEGEVEVLALRRQVAAGAEDQSLRVEAALMQADEERSRWAASEERCAVLEAKVEAAGEELDESAVREADLCARLEAAAERLRVAVSERDRAVAHCVDVNARVQALDAQWGREAKAYKIRIVALQEALAAAEAQQVRTPGSASPAIPLKMMMRDDDEG